MSVAELGWYGTTTVIVSIVGFIPGMWFAWSWGRRVPHPFGWAAFDAGGWVVAFLIIYAMTIVGWLTGAFTGHPSVWQGGVRIALGVIIDLVIIARVIRWRKLRQEYRDGRHSPVEVSER